MTTCSGGCDGILGSTHNENDNGARGRVKIGPIQREMDTQDNELVGDGDGEEEILSCRQGVDTINRRQVLLLLHH